MRITLLLLTVSTILFCSCNKLYWHRTKYRVRQPVKPPSIEVEILNKVPSLFQEDFNEKLKEVCEKEFYKIGYCRNTKPEPDYRATITISMDSFATKGIYYISEGRASFFKPYERSKVFAILFDYQLINVKYKKVKWVDKNDIFFFNNQRKDARRSKNMVKFTIRYGK
jgi:hypothetical protein